MKKNRSILQTALVAAILLGGLSGCDKVNDPEAAIIGRWKMISDGYDEDHMEPVTQTDGSYIEFLSGREYISVSHQGDIFQCPYMIDNTFLYVYDNPDQDRIWKYKFINRDKIKLTHIEGIIETIMYPKVIKLYKRIK
jgi:hypothetical protein